MTKRTVKAATSPPGDVVVEKTMETHYESNSSNSL